MADNDQTLKILVKTEGDTSGLDKAKEGLKGLEDAAGKASQAATILGAAIGASIPLTAQDAILQLIEYVHRLSEEQRQLKEDTDKQSASVTKAAAEWTRFGQTVRTQADLSKLGTAFSAQIDELSTKIAQLALKAGPNLKAYQDLINNLSTGQSGGKDFAFPINEAIKALTELQDTQVATMRTTIEAAQASQAAWEKFKLQPVTQSVSELQKELVQLRADQAALDLTLGIGIQMWTQYQQRVEFVTDALKVFGDLARQRQAFLDQEALTHAQAFGSKEEIEKAKWGKLYNEELARRQALNLPIDASLINQAVYEQIIAEEKKKQTDEGVKLSPLLKDQMTLLQGIRQEQQLISEAPFMGADEKQHALLASSQQEIVKIQQAIQATKAALKSSGLDPEQYAQLEQRLQLLDFRFKQLKQDIPTLDFFGSFRKELQSWANSVGNTGEIVAKGLEQTVGATFQSLNQLLLTGQFNAKTLVQSLANIGLQLIENLAIQQIMATFSHTQAATSQAEGAATAASNAPAAAAKSIAQYGPIVGAALAVAAIAAIIAAVVVGHEGGQITRRRMRRMHGGGLASDEVPIIAQEGEIMIRRDIAQREGMADFLLGLNEGRFHSGGAIARAHGGMAIDPDFFDRGGDIRSSIWFMLQHGFGTEPVNVGNPLGAPGGPTTVPTFWVNYPGVGIVPMAVPMAGWTPDPSDPGYKLSKGTPPRHEAHRGGVISRFHSGGTVGSSSSGGGVHIYAFTDLKALTKHMASKDGQKIIFDTVKGKRIDLGMR